MAKELAIGETGVVDGILVKCVTYDGDCTPCAFTHRTCPPNLCRQTFRKDKESVMFLPVEICTWTQDADGIWYTSCGQAQEFTTGTREENGYRFCPWCGNEITEAKQ